MGGMSHRLITAFANLLPDGGIPTEIVYLPEGTNKITPYVDGKAQTITVNVPADKGAAIAASLQAALVKRQADNVRPWFDFEHKGGASSAFPKEFRYEPGKGVMCSVEWSGAGRAAIEGKDFSYFSPSFLLDDDGFPAGLPNRGPLGALVNEPAFREIPRIAASDAALTNQTQTNMSKLIFAALAISAAHADAETLAVQAIEKLKIDCSTSKDKITALDAQIADLTKQRDDMKAECAKANAKCADAAKLRAEGLVTAAVADGRIAANDDKTKGFFARLITAGDADAEDALHALPRQHTGLDKPIIHATHGERGTGAHGQHAFIAEAHKLVAAKQAADTNEAFTLVAASRPDLYESFMESLSSH